METQYKFTSLLKSEHYKVKRNPAILIMLLFPFIVTLLASLYILYKSGENTTGEIFGYNPWLLLLGRYSFSFHIIYPILVAILCYSLCDMEYKNDNFKLLFTLPYTKGRIYTAKLLFLFEIILISVLIAYASFMLSGFILSYIIPQLSFQDYDIRAIAFFYFSHLFICILSVGLIQYSLSLIFKSFVFPIGFACFTTIFSMIIIDNWDYSYLVPFCLLFKSTNDFFKEITSLNPFDYSCMTYICVFIFIGYMIFKRITWKTK